MERKRGAGRTSPLIPSKSRRPVRWQDKRIVVGCSVEYITPDNPEPVCVAEIPEHMANVRLVVEAGQDLPAAFDQLFRDYKVTVKLEQGGQVWKSDPLLPSDLDAEPVDGEEIRFFLRKGTRAQVQVIAAPKPKEGKIRIHAAFTGIAVPETEFVGEPPPNCQHKGDFFVL